MGYTRPGPQVEAILSALNAALPIVPGAPDERRAWTYDDIKKMPTLPTDYLGVDLSRRFGGTARLDGYAGASAWRVTLRAVSTFKANAEVMLSIAADALELLHLSVGAETSTPLTLETVDPSIEDAEGYWSGLSAWTYHL